MWVKKWSTPSLRKKGKKKKKEEETKEERELGVVGWSRSLTSGQVGTSLIRKQNRNYVQSVGISLRLSCPEKFFSSTGNKLRGERKINKNISYGIFQTHLTLSHA